jgi:cyclic patellamide precursor peptide PatG
MLARSAALGRNPAAQACAARVLDAGRTNYSEFPAGQDRFNERDDTNRCVSPIVSFQKNYLVSRAVDFVVTTRKEYRLENRDLVNFFAKIGRLHFMRTLELVKLKEEKRTSNQVTGRADTAEAFGQNLSRTAVETRLSPLSGKRKVVEAIFSFTNRNTDVIEKVVARVDVTEEFPFLVN